MRTSDLLRGKVCGGLGFLAAVGGLLVLVSLVGGSLAFPPEYLALLRAIGLALLLLPLIPSFTVRASL